jgi:ATP-dependent DNA helicase RecQ
LMEFLQQALDDPDPGPCGRCSVCTKVLPAQGLDLDPASLRAAQVFLRGADVIIEPRKLWPRGISDGRKGRISGATEGRALCFADAPEWAGVVRAIEGPDRELDQEIVDGMVHVLTRWRARWAARPVAVIPMPSSRHSLLIGDLARRIGAVGKLPVVEALEVTGERPPEASASGPKVEALIASLTLRPGVSVPTEGPVLLVDDSYRSGWTMTVAAALLRGAGAASVMPLVVHQLP